MPSPHHKHPAIHVTTDYKKFKMWPNARPLDTKRTIILANRMAKTGFSLLHPIAVRATREGLQILMGKHRFAAAMMVNVPVAYVYATRLTDQDVLEIEAARDWLRGSPCSIARALLFDEVDRVSVCPERVKLLAGQYVTMSVHAAIN